MNDYEARKQARIDRLRERAEKARAEADGRHRAADRIASFIPPGQPILVGHHSEKRHRRDLEKIDNHIGKAVAASERAEELESRADAAESNDAVSSLDPDALAKLREKLAAAEAWHAEAKKTNAAVRRAEKAVEKATGRDWKAMSPEERAGLLVGVEASEAARKELLSWARAFPWLPQLPLANYAAEVRRLKARIADLERRKTTAPRGPVTVPVPGCEGIMATVSETETHLEVKFSGRIGKEAFKAWRTAGFLWSKTRGRFVRQRGAHALYAAARMLGLERLPEPSVGQTGQDGEG